MTNVFARPASHENAIDPRSGELRAGGGSWPRTLRQARRALDVSVRRIDSSTRVVGAAQRHAFGPLNETTQRLKRVSLSIIDAGANLQRAALGLLETNQCIALAPELAAGAPEQCIELTALWIETAQRLAALSNWMEAMLKLCVTGPRTTQIRKPEDGHRPAIPVRRQRLTPLLTVAEAPRRISRGRAPPLLSTCTL
jgi:hypothetical protein